MTPLDFTAAGTHITTVRAPPPAGAQTLVSLQVKIPAMTLEKELEAAVKAARAAGENALRAQSGNVAAEQKPDDTPVTAVDRQNERIVAGLLTDAFPEDGLLGEEGASRQGSSGRRWIIDPIDGTRDFIRGLPAWSVMIGLEAADDIAVGVIYFPALGEVYAAARGHGAFRNETRLRVSPISRIEQSVLCANGLKFLPGSAIEHTLLGWMPRFWAVRAFGGALDAMYVAAGRAEVYVEPHVKPWDLAAMKIILEEAGARMFSFKGRASIYDGTCAACVPALEAEVRRFLGCP
jgi:histidinol-phosphatase